MWSNSGSVLGVCWYTVTGSGHWSLGWKVLGTFSLIPAPTKIPMAIFFIAIGQIFAYQKSPFVCDEICLVNFENHRNLNLKVSIMSRIKF